MSVIIFWPAWILFGFLILNHRKLIYWLAERILLCLGRNLYTLVLLVYYRHRLPRYHFVLHLELLDYVIILKDGGINFRRPTKFIEFVVVLLLFDIHWIKFWVELSPTPFFALGHASYRSLVSQLWTLRLALGWDLSHLTGSSLILELTAVKFWIFKIFLCLRYRAFLISLRSEANIRRIKKHLFNNLKY